MSNTRRVSVSNTVLVSTFGAVVNTLLFHQCDLGLIPSLCSIYELSLPVLFCPQRGFSSGTLVFPSR